MAPQFYAGPFLWSSTMIVDIWAVALFLTAYMIHCNRKVEA